MALAGQDAVTRYMRMFGLASLIMGAAMIGVAKADEVSPRSTEDGPRIAAGASRPQTSDHSTAGGCGPYLIGGAVYEDCENPLTSGLSGVTVTVECLGGFTDTAVTGGAQGLWQMDCVPEDTCTVTPSLPGETFCHVLGECPPVSCIGSAEIEVNDANQGPNQSIQFVADGCGAYLIGGAIYEDCDNPLTSGLAGVTVTAECLGGFTDTAVTEGAQGLWQMDCVPEDTCTVTPSLAGRTFCDVVGVCPPDPCVGSAEIEVNDANQGPNQSIQFVADDCGPYLIGGAIYEDCDNPLTSGLAGVTVTVECIGGFTDTAVTEGAQGLWQMDCVPEDTCTVTPSLADWAFCEVMGECPPIPCIGSAKIEVNDANQGPNQSIQFLAVVEPPEIVHGFASTNETSPCTGYIDSRLESDNGVDVNLGISEVTIVFSEPVYRIGAPGLAPDTSSFAVTETGGELPPLIAEVIEVDPVTFVVRLSRIVTLKEWTTIIAQVQDADGNSIISSLNRGPGETEPDRVDIAFLPCDINQDGLVSPKDLINLRQFLTAATYHNDCDDIWYFDIDRDGVMPEPQDLLRFRQMIEGTPPATRRWALETMNHLQP